MGSMDGTIAEVRSDGAGARKKRAAGHRQIPQGMNRRDFIWFPRIPERRRHSCLPPDGPRDAPEGCGPLRRPGGLQGKLPLLMDRAYGGNGTRRPARELGFGPVVPPPGIRFRPRSYGRGCTGGAMKSDDRSGGRRDFAASFHDPGDLMSRSPASSRAFLSSMHCVSVNIRPDYRRMVQADRSGASGANGRPDADGAGGGRVMTGFPERRISDSRFGPWIGGSCSPSASPQAEREKGTWVPCPRRWREADPRRQKGSFAAPSMRPPARS